MNYYEHHIGDYDADTAHLTWAEDMAYTRLLRLYYRKEAPIPANLNDACRLIRAVAKDQKQAVESVLREFFELRDDGWHQARCDSEIFTYQKKVEHNQRVGKLGGRPRKAETHSEPEKNPVGYFREPEQNPPQTPDTRHQTPDTITTKEVKGVQTLHEIARATPAEVCVGMKAVGMASVNPSSPKLIALLDAGITKDELIQAAADAVASQKSFAYALAMAEGRRNDAAKVHVLPAKTQNRQIALEQRNRQVADAWAAQGNANDA